MARERRISLEEAIGELNELRTRVVWLEVRGSDGKPVVTAEGELSHIEHSASEGLSFRLGGREPPAVEGVEFIVASWLEVHLDPGRVVEAWDESSERGGPRITLRLRLVDGIDIALWPAMPPEQQWTEAHDAVR